MNAQEVIDIIDPTRFKLVRLDEFSEFDWETAIDEPYEKFIARQGSYVTILGEVMQGYSDVICDDGMELPALSNYHLEGLDEEDFVV